MKLWLGSALFRAIDRPLHSTGSPSRRLRHLIRRQLRFIGRREGIPKLLRSDRLHLESPALRRSVTAIMARYQAEVAQLVRVGIERGEFRHDLDPEHIARSLALLIQGLVVNWSLSGFSYRLENATEDVWQLIWPAIRSPETSLPQSPITDGHARPSGNQHRS